MNIYVVSQYFHPDNFKINDTVADFAKRGHTVSVLAGLPDYETKLIRKDYRFFRKRKEDYRGTRVKRVQTISRREGGFFRILTYFSFAISGFFYTKFCKKEKTDVIFVSQITPVLQAIPALSYSKRVKAPLVLYCMDIWPEVLKAWDIKESSFIFKRALKMSQSLYKRCDLVLISSKPFKEYLTNVIGLDEQKIIYLPQYAEDLYENIVGKYIENDIVDFLFAGNIGTVQDVETIIYGIKEIEDNDLNKGKDYLVHIVGDGIKLDSCKTLASELEIRKRIVFHGRHPLEDMEKFYHLADCFLLTMRGGDFISATLPGKAQSYLSVGKPIVGAIDGAGKEMVIESDSGLVVDAGDYIGLANIMASVILDCEAFKAKGLKGRSYYEDHYTKDKFMDKLFGIFDKAIIDFK